MESEVRHSVHARSSLELSVCVLTGFSLRAELGLSWRLLFFFNVLLIYIKIYKMLEI